MKLPWLCAISVMTFAGFMKTAWADNTYVALVPSGIRAGTTLRVPIKFLTTPTTEQVTVTLKNKDNVTVATTTDVADGMTSITPELEVPTNVDSGMHWVEVVGRGSVPFSNSTSVWPSWKSMSIFVQTDKATYKPGDTVKYRVFAVNSSADIIGPILNIEIKDPKGNKIDEHMGVSSRFGIAGELALSDMPPLGEWLIVAEAPDFRNTETRYNFGVEEYVLPKFEVTVNLPPFLTMDMDNLVGSVKVEYTFGKPVSGHLRLTVSKRYSYGFFTAKAIVRDLEIDGEVSFEIPTKVLKSLSKNLIYDSLRVHANVTEDLTGITLGGQAEVRYYESKYKVEFFPQMPDYFRTQFNPYRVLIKVLEQDDRPPVNPTQQLAVTVTYFTDRPIQGPVPERLNVGDLDVLSPFSLGDTIIMNTVQYPLAVDGTAEFNLTIPESAATATIKAEFAGKSFYKDIKRFRSPGEVFLKANLANGNNLKIRDVAVIELLSTEGPVTAQYIVIAKGQIVATGDIKIETLIDGQYLGTGAFAITREMAPSSRFVAYFVRADKEIVAEGLNFVVDGIFENEVSIQMNQTSTVKPKTGVSIQVQAESDSLVYVLGVDESVLLKRTGNDITPSRVSEELRRYGNSPWIARGWGHHGFWPWPVMADDAWDIFNVVNLRVLTNALLYKFDLWRLEQQMMKFGGSGGRMMSASFAAPSDGVGGPPAAERTVRKDFPETWIWASGPITDGSFIVPTKAPDTITTFVVNAFALSPTKGLGVAPITSNLTVFLPYFVNIQLPYSVVRGEIAIIQANVFNYHPATLNVLVTLVGSSEFIGVSVDANGNEVNVTGNLQKCVQVLSGKPVAVFFSVRPTIIGSMTVNVIISSQYAQQSISDDVTRILPVKAEGSPKQKNHAELFSFKSFGSETVNVDIRYPAEVVPQSQRLRITAIGDLFGPTLRNLDKILKMPYGCGEQNMLNFAPDVFAAMYLKETNRTAANADLIKKIKSVLKVGYQRQLVYQRSNGSFSVFGDADKEGSLWLTAFVVKSFAQASKLKLIYIDVDVINKAVRYIMNYQEWDGRFTNTGIVHNRAMQGGSARSVNALTAYVLIALREVQLAEILTDQSTIILLKDAVKKAADLLLLRRNRMETEYELAIGAYALKLVNEPKHMMLLRRLQRSPNRTVEGTMMHWSHPSPALEIELASYVLLTYASMKDEDNGFPILNWLVKQSNGNGGFISTQDTVVALQALSEFAAVVYSADVNLDIDFYTTKDGVASPKQSLTLNNSNHDLLHYKDFNGEVDTFTVEVKGRGLVLANLNLIYNEYEDPEPPSYELDLSITEQTKKKYILKACARYNIPQSRSNMAIMDIGFISGFEPVTDQIEKTPADPKGKKPIMKRVEVSAGRLILYFDEIPSQTICVSVPAQRVSLVAGVKPANVLIYSYYEPAERVLKNYIPSILQTPALCATCGAECGCPSKTPKGATAELALGLCNVGGY